MTDQPLEPDERSARPDTGEEPTRVRPSSAAEEPTRVQPPPPPSPPPERRRLVRTRDDRVIAGVCGGLGRYLGLDPVIIRIAALVLVFAGGAGVLLYLVGWIAIPEERAGTTVASAAPPSPSLEERAGGAGILGLVFVALGAFFLADAIWPDFLAWRYVWPIALILIGAAILLRARRP